MLNCVGCNRDNHTGKPVAAFPALIRAGLLLTVLACASCAGKPQGFVASDSIRTPSDSGARVYMLAKEQYGKVRLMDYRGQALATEMDKVFTLLNGAQANDLSCPLFHAKAGELFLEVGPSGYDRAVLELQNALATCPEWVPAHIAMGDLAARQGKLQDAAQHLQNAETYLHAIQQRTSGSEKTRPLGSFSIMGLNAAPIEGQSDNDPRLPDAQRMRLLINWLQDSEQWTIENRSLVIVSGGQVTMNGACQDNLFRRLRARIEFQRIMIEKQGDPTPAVVAAKLDQRSLYWDPNYFPARFEKAMQLCQAGQCRAAERILAPDIESGNPMLKNNANLTHALACIYAHWFSIEGGADVADNAQQYFQRLHDLNPRHADGWHDRACFYVQGIVKLNRSDLLQVARQCLDRSVECGYLDNQEIKRVQALINDAAKSHSTTAPTAGAQL